MDGHDMMGIVRASLSIYVHIPSEHLLDIVV